MLKPVQTRVLLITITMFSFGLRVWGLQHGLPFEYHPDEQQYILPGIGVVSGNFAPLAYYNPTLYPYLIGLVYTLTYLALRLFNTFPEFWNLNAAWGDAMLPWTTGLIYLARYLTTAVGVFTTLIVYHLGRRAYNNVTGIGAAIIFGLTFLPIRESHFAVSDAPVALFVALTLYLALDVVRRGHWTGYLWSGIAFGLAIATKYNAVLLVPSLVLTHFLSKRYMNWPARFRSLWLPLITGVTGVAGYMLVSPYTLLRWNEFWEDFNENLQSGQRGFSGFELDPTGNGALFYIKSLIWGMGWPIVLVFSVAIILALWRHRRNDVLLVSLPLVLFTYMQRQEMYFVRWLMPLIPPLCVLAAETVRVAVDQLIKEQTPTRWSVAAVSLLVTALLTLPATVMAVKADHVFSQLDTRTEALEWIAQHIPPGSQLAVRILSPPWTPPLAMPGLSIGPYRFAQVPNGGIADVTLQQFRDWQVEYVVTTSFYDTQPKLDKIYQAERATRMQTLDDQAELLATFNPYACPYPGFFYHDQVYGPANDVFYRRQPGPIIKIYRLP